MGRPKRRFSQNFLSDPRLLDRIAQASGATNTSTVLEIGPGPGGLTAALARRAGKVIAIEKDPELARDLVGRWRNVEVIEGDALELDWHALAGSGALVTGNIPYNITSPLIDKALQPPRPPRIVFLVQSEVADRVAAAPGTESYGALSAGVQAVARARRLFGIPRGAFRPVPNVDSAVLSLEPLDVPIVGDDQLPAFRRLVVGLFGFRRKQLLRGLRELTGWPAERVMPILEALQLDPTRRPETLSPKELAALTNRVVDDGWQVGERS